MNRLWKLFVGALAVLAAPVAGHGYLAQPASRNLVRNSDYCPACLNGGGTWQVYASGLPGRYGVCGDAYKGPRPHEIPGRAVQTYRSGQSIKVRVELTANHMGRWGLKLCPSSTPTQSCFNRLPLKRTDGKRYTNVPSSRNTFTATYRLPKGVTCSKCTLQWTYETANSCNLPGSPRIAGLPACQRSPNWERFWNCADIRIA